MSNKIINPFLYLADKQLALLGIFSTLFGIFFGVLFNVSFDGCLDVHFTDKIQLSETMTSLFIAIMVLDLVLFSAGKLVNSKTRFIDILIVVLIARIPLYTLTLFNFRGFTYQKTKLLQTIIIQSNGDYTAIKSQMQALIPFLIFSSILSLLALAFFITLLFNGYKNATNLRENKHIFTFIGAIFLAEILSKTILSFI